MGAPSLVRPVIHTHIHTYINKYIHIYISNPKMTKNHVSELLQKCIKVTAPRKTKND